MYHKAKIFLPIFLFFISIFTITHNNVHAQEAPESCKIQDRGCIIDNLIKETALIDNAQWKDKTYREIAKTLAFDGEFDKSVSIIGLIETPENKAITIRGIGIALAAHNYKQDELKKKFATLRLKADEITNHPPSHGIALSYIAMAQAFTGDNEGSWKTTEDMKNQALKNKAYGETANIQAQKGDFTAAQTSINKIENLTFRNKAYETISKILSEEALYNEALIAAKAITNPYKKTQSLQYMLDKQKPRDRLQDKAEK